MTLPATVSATIFVGVVSLLALGSLAAQTPLVASNAAELHGKLSQAKGGETILLGDGSYGDLQIVGRRFERPVTVRSADPNRPAIIRRLKLKESSNLTFERLEIGGALRPPEPRWTRMIEIGGSTHILFDRVYVHGSVDDDRQNDGWGFFIRDSHDVSVQNSEIQHVWRGVLVQSSVRLKLVGNKFHDLQSDGVNFAGTRTVLIENNSFRDFYPAATDHADAIQFWTAGQTQGNNDVVIRGNVIMQGKGDGLQGIFIGNELKLPSRNVLIENNILYSAVQYHGIAIHGWSEVRISGNTVLSPIGDAARYWIRLFDVKDADVTGNVTDDIVLENSKARMKDNIVLVKGNGGRLRRSLKPATAVRLEELIMPGRGYQPPRAEGN